ncbi:hypothetical protein G7K_6068-t1 [Saitoella complicata NRRL Y-17804]|uniref:Uncharacterized protein n=1 Tax=Saitoella complicata (strain BCRC 22490 / CBS 7301 / JCM 7358 / NBRC 10748 / NRRL Y-17804) TaxID=698492 RepID=A0A0E9NRD5_SAICN|nr:hypothetical protein G7K_6068-t1 [Saitoella complicata NRRL Y-17804]
MLLRSDDLDDPNDNVGTDAAKKSKPAEPAYIPDTQLTVYQSLSPDGTLSPVSLRLSTRFGNAVRSRLPTRSLSSRI